jgi:MFS family permease
MNQKKEAGGGSPFRVYFQGLEAKEFLLDTHKNEGVGDGHGGIVIVDAHSSAFLFGLNAFGFLYGFIISTIGLLVLPSEAIRLSPANPGLLVGVMTAVCGLSQLASPVCGYLSDRCGSACGRRSPFILGGAVVQFIGVLGMFIAREHMLLLCFLAATFIAVIGINVAYNAYNALIADIVHLPQMGMQSGILGVETMLGAFLGFLALGMLGKPSHCYFLYCVATVVCTACTLWFGSPHEVPLREEQVQPVVWEELRASFWIDKSKHPNFYWVFVLRFCYYMGVSVQIYILFFLRDVIRVTDPAFETSALSMYAQFAAVLVSYPAGKLSDRVGRKPLVVFACVVMSCVYALFLVSSSRAEVRALGFVYGIGNGMFLAVDQALVNDTLPNAEDRGRMLGVWGVAAFLGSTLGGFTSGMVLDVVGSGYIQQHDRNVHDLLKPLHHYGFDGYVAIMSIGCFWFLLASLCLLKINLARRV